MTATKTMMTEYFNRQRELTEKYGEKSVVLFECGGFYEVYEERPCTCTVFGAATDAAGATTMCELSLHSSRTTDAWQGI